MHSQKATGRIAFQVYDPLIRFGSLSNSNKFLLVLFLKMYPWQNIDCPASGYPDVQLKTMSLDKVAVLFNIPDNRTDSR